MILLVIICIILLLTCNSLRTHCIWVVTERKRQRQRHHEERGIERVLYTRVLLTFEADESLLGQKPTTRIKIFSAAPYSLDISMHTTAFFPLSIEEVMVASNAAIGGPATAAAFAGSVSNKRMAPRKRRDLALAGTVVGVLGYAIGTSIGLGLSGLLLD